MRAPPSPYRRRLAPAVAVLALLGGCTVGPDYHRPDVATPATYSELARPAAAPISRPDAAPVSEAAIAAWWTSFDDPTLDWLVHRALADNLSLKSDFARIRAAREQEAVQGAAGLPQANVTGSVARVNDNASSFNNLFNQNDGGGTTGNRFNFPSHINNFAIAFDATWEIDVFGGVRRGVEAARAGAEAAVWNERDGQVSLTSEIANDYFTLRALQAEIAIAEEEVDRQKDTFTIVGQQRSTGFVNKLNLNQQEVQVQQTIATIPNLQAQARGQIHALGVLLGLDPEALDARLSPPSNLPLPTPPSTLPVGLPSDLLRRRPDVRAAERQLAQATAQVGVQVSNLYPKFNILALAPIANNSISGLFDADKALSIGAGMVRWPIFQGGQIRAGVRAARAQQDQAYYAYQNAVLGALRDVEDALARYTADQRRIVAQADAVKASDDSLLIARQQYEVGLVSYLNVLQAQQSLLNSRTGLVQDQAQLAADLVSLYRALGGGWTADEGKLLTKAGVSYP